VIALEATCAQARHAKARSRSSAFVGAQWVTGSNLDSSVSKESGSWTSRTPEIARICPGPEFGRSARSIRRSFDLPPGVAKSAYHNRPAMAPSGPVPEGLRRLSARFMKVAELIGGF
jgi:hypothetical protein